MLKRSRRPVSALALVVTILGMTPVRPARAEHAAVERNVAAVDQAKADAPDAPEKRKEVARQTAPAPSDGPPATARGGDMSTMALPGGDDKSGVSSQSI